MSKSQPSMTKLPVEEDFPKLLVALDGPVDPAELVSRKGSPRSIHARCLAAFLGRLDREIVDVAYQCCLKLLAMNAPIIGAPTDGGGGAATSFCSYPWRTDATGLAQVIELADAYVAAGAWDLDKHLDGQILSREEREESADYFVGLNPLAVAIFNGHKPMTRYLVDRGTSMDLGSVYAGEPAVNAIDLALEEGEVEIHSMLIAALMKRKLESCALDSADSPESPGQATAPRRNRSRVL